MAHGKGLNNSKYPPTAFRQYELGVLETHKEGFRHLRLKVQSATTLAAICQLGIVELVRHARLVDSHAFHPIYLQSRLRQEETADMRCRLATAFDRQNCRGGSENQKKAGTLVLSTGGFRGRAATESQSAQHRRELPRKVSLPGRTMRNVFGNSVHALPNVSGQFCCRCLRVQSL